MIARDEGVAGGGILLGLGDDAGQQLAGPAPERRGVEMEMGVEIGPGGVRLGKGAEGLGHARRLSMASAPLLGHQR